MNCEKCGRTGLTAKELAIHNKYFHGKKSQVKVTINESCPDCGAVLLYMEGCTTCTSCGYSRCN